MSYVRGLMKGRFRTAAVAIGSVAVVCAVIAQGAAVVGTSPGAPELESGGADAVPSADAGSDATAGPDVALAIDVAPDADEMEAEASAAALPDDPGGAGAWRAAARRRQAALVGGWVASAYHPETFTVAVDDLILEADGEWTRRLSQVCPDRGLLAPGETWSGTWFTEEGALVLLDRGSPAVEVLRSPYAIDDRSEQLTLQLSGGPVVYYRYR